MSPPPLNSPTASAQNLERTLLCARRSVAALSTGISIKAHQNAATLGPDTLGPKTQPCLSQQDHSVPSSTIGFRS